MDRKEFIKSTLKGTCVCTMLLLGGKSTFADENEKKPKKDNKDQEFITGWTENLMEIMDQNLDEKTRKKIMEQSGRKCAEKTYKKIALKYKGNIKGLLDLMKQQWAESVDFDKEKNTIRVAAKKAKACFCPMVKGRSTLSSGTYCLCSQGWAKEVFETASGKKVEVELEKTILRGADQCVFKITLAS